jgi:hypothetical protein
VAKVLELPLTLHYALAPGLERAKKRDPGWHKSDNAPPEVTMVAVVVIVLKMVYGLDGRRRSVSLMRNKIPRFVWPAWLLSSAAGAIEC